MQKDNSTGERKVALRKQALALCAADAPILETHGGYGRIGERCYDGRTGLVIEKDGTKAEHLAQARPSWRVYQGECEKALAAGLGADLAFGLIDLDPYGSPLPVLRAIFSSQRKLPDQVQLVVNDGSRQRVRVGRAWATEVLKAAVRRHGNQLYHCYLEVARELVEETVAGAGFSVATWRGYYCGNKNDMTHYWAALVRN
jgi:hypothetical protein